MLYFKCFISLIKIKQTPYCFIFVYHFAHLWFAIDLNFRILGYLKCSSNQYLNSDFKTWFQTVNNVKNGNFKTRRLNIQFEFSSRLQGLNASSRTITVHEVDNIDLVCRFPLNVWQLSSLVHLSFQRHQIDNDHIGGILEQNRGPMTSKRKNYKILTSFNISNKFTKASGAIKWAEAQ